MVYLRYPLGPYQHIFGHWGLETTTEFLEDKFKMAAEMSLLGGCQEIGPPLLLLKKMNK